MNRFASFLFASISIISSCSALDYTVIDTVDIDDTSDNLPPPLVAERDDEEAVPSIVGGDTAADGAYPWFGRSHITYSESGTTVHSVTCGASLIHPRVAISAMHCAKGVLAPTFYDIKVTLYFGANSYDGSDALAIRNVKELRYPATYNFPMNDIVLYTWDEPSTTLTRSPLTALRISRLPISWEELSALV
jgi:secreted trypsin-like serine protease